MSMQTNTVMSPVLAMSDKSVNGPQLATSGPQLLDKPADRDPLERLPWLPCTLCLDIPVVNFKIADLLTLTRGSIVETAYHQSSDLPLRVNGQLVGWTEFEVVGERLAVRLTDLP